jgi:hypothetical protein
MDAARLAAHDTLEEVADALKDAQRALRRTEVVVRKKLRGNLLSADILRADPVVDYRPNLDEALARLEQVRHTMLLRVFAVALGDGMTIGELSRNYGFSRQLASRYAKEARELH